MTIYNAIIFDLIRQKFVTIKLFSIEEIESLREKMQSDSSLVIVGYADDVLRVPKSRCRLENVTQAMVDTMVVVIIPINYNKKGHC